MDIVQNEVEKGIWLEGCESNMNHYDEGRKPASHCFYEKDEAIS
jgi:hypothetical protein